MKKKQILTFLMMLCVFSKALAQRHEIGVQLGVSNLVGDIGKTDFFLQRPVGNISNMGVPFNAGLMYRFNFNPYQTVRLNLGYSHIQFDDKAAKEDYRRNRKLWGTNSIFEADLLFEYNFLPVNEEQKGLLSPYIFGGVGALYMEAVNPRLDIDKDANVQISYTQGNRFTMAIPFGIGLKYKFNYNWAISGELTFKPTFSDQVDYSKIKDKDVEVYSELEDAPTAVIVNDFINSRTVGNVKSKDWINSASIILSYSFGRPPCYCK